MKILNQLKWQSWSLPYKLILLYVPLIIVPAITGLNALSTSFVDSNRETVNNYSNELLALITEKLDARVVEVQEISFQIFWDSRVHDFLTVRGEDPYEIINTKKEIKTRIQALTAGSEQKYIKSVVILSRDDRIVVGDDDLTEYKDRNTRFMNGIREKQGKPVWFLPNNFKTPNSEFQAFRLGRLVRDEKLQEIGMIYLVLDTKIFSEYFDQLNRTKIDEHIRWQLLNENNGTLLDFGADQIHLSNDPVVISHPLDNGWTLRATLPLQNMYEKIGKITSFALWITFFCLCAGIFATVLITVDVVLPVRKIVHNMKQGIKGASPSALKHFNGAKEIVDLNETFISVMYEIEHLHHETVRIQSQRRDAEIKVLQNQLAPHFLYNALNTIRWMAILQKQNNIKEIVDALSALLDYTIRNTDKRVSLAEEVAVLREYVRIKKVQYMDFQFKVDLEEGLSGRKVIKFLIQPLIENALIHGLAGSARGGVITLSIHAKNKNIAISVTDNGQGIRPAELDKLKSSITSVDDSGHIGLRSVAQRIWLHYGLTYGVTIESQERLGTTVTVILPLGDERDEDGHDR